MPKGYWVTCYRSISDPQKLAAYAKLAPAATAPFGGRYLVRGNRGGGLRGRPQGAHRHLRISRASKRRSPPTTVPAYQDALKALGDGAVRDIRIVEGLE